MSRLQDRRWTILGTLAGLLALGFLAHRAGLGGALRGIRAVGPTLLLMLVPYAVGTALFALPWGLLLGAKLRPTWRAVVGTRFAAAAVNVVLPSGFFGEPLRLRAVRAAARATAGEALVWDRSLYLMACGTFVGLAALGAAGRGGPAFLVASAMAFALYVVGGASLVGLTQWGPFRRWFGARLARRWPRFAHPSPALRPAWTAALACFAVHLVARSAVATEVWLGAKLLGLHLGPGGWLFAAGAMALSAAAAPVVPGQLGVQEAALVGALASMGVPLPTALALGLVLRVRQLVFVPIGFAMVTSPLTRPAPELTPCPPAPESSRA